MPTADRKLGASVFVLMGATGTGLEADQVTGTFGGRNLTFSAGADLDFLPLGRFLLGAEVRGTYPVKDGDIVAERAVLGGARVSYVTSGAGPHVLHPYADALFGRGQLDYPGGYLTENFLYSRTVGNVFGGGIGAEWDLAHGLAAKADAQVQHWGTPVVPSGAIYSKQLSAGVVYRFGTGQGPR